MTYRASIASALKKERKKKLLICFVCIEDLGSIRRPRRKVE
jgi:hypothetical protein